MLADYQKIPSSLGMWSGPTAQDGVTAEVVEYKPGADIRGKLVTANGEQGGEALSAVDFDRYYQAFPALKANAQPALAPEDKLPPGQEIKRTVMVSFPVTLDAFNQDLINGIVANYAEPGFHCELHLVTHPKSGDLFPIIVVPSIQATPVRAKRDGPQDANGKPVHRLIG